MTGKCILRAVNNYKSNDFKYRPLKNNIIQRNSIACITIGENPKMVIQHFYIGHNF